MSPTDDFLGMRPGSRGRRALQWLAVALAGLAVVIMVGRFVNGGEATRYNTAAVAREDLQSALAGTGALLSVGQRVVTAEVDGVVADVVARDGERIAKGQVLARLDPAALIADAAQAQSVIGARETALNAATAAEREARDQLRRFEAVRERSNNLAPSDREMAIARDAAQNAAERARSAAIELDAARARLAERQALLAAAQIVSPIDGVVIRRRIVAGQAVSAHDTPLFEISDAPTRLQMQVLVDRAAAQELKPGAPAQVTIGKQAYGASIAQMRPARSADETQAMLLLDVANPTGILRPGLMAEARIPLAAHKDALIVPAEALEFARASDKASADKPSDAAVYVLNEQGAPRRVPVTLEGGDAGKIAVSGALSPGAPVITGLR